MKTKLLSTSALAREMGKSKDLFELLLERDYIGRENDNWVLTRFSSLLNVFANQAPILP